MATPNIRVRIAPSPTGNLHVGTARAALFNELFARREGGTFIIRIEDTDKERSEPQYEANIIEGLKWLGLTWQEGPDVGGEYGPYRQSERQTQHTAAIQQLLDSGAAYIDEAQNAVIRLKVAPQEVTFTDLIRGTVTVHSDTWGGDFVIARSLTDSLFHLAVVVDDAAQQITHVIRGEDHLTNTARHILLQRALGIPTPEYAHLPLLLDEARRKLSKRSGETNLLAYRELGYLPEAMVNYLALLGWNPKNDQEFFTHDELVPAFSFAGVQKGGAIFSITKLNAINRHYVRQLSPADLLNQTQVFLKKEGIESSNSEFWQQALVTEQPRVDTLQELAVAVSFFKEDWAGDYTPDLLIWRKSTPEATKERLEKTIEFLTTLTTDDFTIQALETKLLTWIDAEDLGRGDTLWPLRVALTGREHSPGPFEVAAVLSKEATLARLQAASAKL
ncbi:MAG: glutamate--tRNA ligase family protein [Candidatus Andersenbacteria bacterium]